MPAIKRTIAAVELLLVFPATLFMAGLFVRNLQPAEYEPAHTAQRVVEWFARRPHIGLDLFLIAMPFAALVIGAATVWRSWRSDAETRRAALETLAAVRAHLATLLIAGATLIAGVILGIVVLHMAAD